MISTKSIQKFCCVSLATAICYTSASTTVRFDSVSSQLRVGIGEPAYAGRRRMWSEALSYIASEVTDQVIEQGVGLAFNVARDRLSASSQRTDTYVGSYFADTYRNLYLAWSPTYGWTGLNPATGRWQSVTPPTYTIWRLSDVYQKSDGRVYGVSFY